MNNLNANKNIISEKDFINLLKENGINYPSNNFIKPSTKNINDKETIKYLNNYIEELFAIMNIPEIKEHIEIEYKDNNDNRKHIKESLKDIVIFNEFQLQQDSKNTNLISLDKLKRLKPISKFAFILSSYERLAHLVEAGPLQQSFFNNKNTFIKELLYCIDKNTNKSQNPYLDVALRQDKDNINKNYNYVIDVSSCGMLPFSVHTKLYDIKDGLNERKIPDSKLEADINSNKYRDNLMQNLTCNSFYSLPIEVNPEFDNEVNQMLYELQLVNPEITKSDVILNLALVNKEITKSISNQYHSEVDNSQKVSTYKKSYYSVDSALTKTANKHAEKQKNIEKETNNSLIYIFSAYKYKYSDIQKIIENQEESKRKVNEAQEILKKQDSVFLDKAKAEISYYNRFIQLQNSLLQVCYESDGNRRRLFLKDKKTGEVDPIENISAGIDKEFKNFGNKEKNKIIMQFFISLTDLELKKEIIENCPEEYKEGVEISTDSLEACNTAFAEIMCDDTYTLENMKALQELSIIANGLFNKNENVNLAEVSNRAYQYGINKEKEEQEKNESFNYVYGNSTYSSFENILENKLNNKFVNEQGEPIINFFDSSNDVSLGIAHCKNKRAERIKFYLQYLKIYEKTDIDIPKEIEEITSPKIQNMLTFSKELDVNPFDLENLQDVLNTEFSDSQINFKDDSLDKIYGIDKLSDFEKISERIILNLKFIRQQNSENPEILQSYSNFKEGYQNIEKILGEEPDIDTIGLIMLEDSKKADLVRQLDDENPIVKYLKKNVFEIEEVPKATVKMMENIMIEKITSGKISNSILKDIKLTNQQSIENSFTDKEIMNAKRIATVKLAISKTKYSDKQKEYLIDVLRNVAFEKYNMKNDIFNKLGFELDKSEKQMFPKCNEFFNSLEKSIDTEKLEEASQIFENLKKERECDEK